MGSFHEKLENIFVKNMVGTYSTRLKIGMIFALAYAFGLGSLIGIVQFRYESKSSGQFVVKFYARAYSLLVSCIIAIVYPYFVLQTLQTKVEIFDTDRSQGIVIILQLSGNYISLILVYVAHFFSAQKCVDVLNGNVNLHRNIVGISGNDLIHFPWTLFFRFIVKALVTTLLGAVSSALYISEMDTTFNCGCFWVSYFLLFYPYFVQNIAANFYFFGTLRAELYFKIINRDVEKITDMLKDLKSLSNYKRIQKFCTLSDRLDFLSMAHYETGILMRAVNTLYGSQMLLFIVIAFLNSLVQLFYLYTTVKFNLYGLEKPNWKLSVYSIMFAYVQIVDLFAHARATQITTTVSQKTGQLLHELPVQNIDDRFKKSVDMFSIQVLQNK